jgi:cytochrome c biogenesis protein CcdA
MVGSVRKSKLFLLILLPLLILGAAGRALAQGDATVRLVYFYRDDCPHCIAVLNEILLPLQAEYGQRLEMKLVQFHDPTRTGEIDPQKYAMLLQAEEIFGVTPEERGIPMLVVGGEVLIGEDEIRERLRCVLETCLASRGTAWPDIPGLEAVPPYGQGGSGLSIVQPPVVAETEACITDAPVCAPAAPQIWVAYFYQVGCQECSRAESDIQYMRSLYPQMLVEEFNINERVDLARWMAARVGREQDLHTPAVFIGDDALIGKEEITPDNLKRVLEKYLSGGTKRFWQDAEVPEVRLPEVMTVVLAGLLDGLNPCAFATLIFFISYLTFTGRKGAAVLTVGTAFALGVFLAYTLVGIGLWRVLNRVPSYTILGRLVIGLTALMCGTLAVLSLLDYLKARRGRITEMALVMPEGLRRSIHSIIRRSSNVRVLALVALPVGMVISLLELACTGQVYLPTIIFVMSQPGLKVRALSFLLLYNLMFILPLVVVFVLAYLGTSSLRLGLFLRRHAATIKLGTALLFAALAAWLVVSVVI